MSEGLEDFLEGLIPKVAYSGEKGMPISTLLRIVKEFHDKGEDLADENGAAPPEGPSLAQAVGSQDVVMGNADAPANWRAPLSERERTESEFATARWAFDWLKLHPEITIQASKSQRSLTLDQILELPDDLKRPSLRASDELMWMSIAGHRRDNRRVPELEWQCLLGIAVTEFEGIFQGDLITAIGQDKRSVPKRTDALAQKGYIVKRTVSRRKQKTSKLWLTRFAPPSLASSDISGLDLSAENMTKDLEPVAWADRWTGSDMDMEAFGRTLLALTRGWKVMRYVDLKKKLGILDMRWQMKVLSRWCRRFVSVGILKYSAAVFPGQQQIWKDCIKFVREPTFEEWNRFLATGKKTSAHSGSSRPSKASDLIFRRDPGPEQFAEDVRAEAARRRLIHPGFEPSKPFQQSVFEVIQAAGKEGASIPQISTATIGYGFRRFLGAHLERTAAIDQPPHLEKFQLDRTLVREGKTHSYMYSARYGQLDTTGEASNKSDALPSVSGPAADNKYGFGEVDKVSLAGMTKGESKNWSEMSRSAPWLSKVKQRKRPLGLDILAAREKGDEDVVSKVPWVTEAPAEIVGSTVEAPDGDVTNQVAEVANPASTMDSIVQDVQPDVEEPPPSVKEPTPEPVPERPPGVYLGVPNSLDRHRPSRDTRGRKRRSIVITFRSDKLKDPNFLAPKNPGTLQEDTGDGSITAGCKPVNGSSADTSLAKGSATAETGSLVEVAKPHGKARGKGTKVFACEKCGGTWKNDVGLVYHLKKSKGPCNPDWAPEERALKRRRELTPPPPSQTPDPLGEENAEIANGENQGQGRGATKRSKSAKKDKSATSKRSEPIFMQARRPTGGVGPRFRGLNVKFSHIPLDLQDLQFAPIAPRKGEEFVPVLVQKPRAPPVVSKNPNALRDAQDLSETPAVGKKTPREDVEHLRTLQPLPGTPGPLLPQVHRPPRGEQQQAYPAGPLSTEKEKGIDKPAASETYPKLDDEPIEDSELPGGTELTQPQIDPALEVSQIHPTFLGSLDTDDMELDERLPVSKRIAVESNLGKPFRPEDYSSIKKEHHLYMAIMGDIINYLLDNTCGVFPGERALFYAMLKIFLQAFPDMAPFTWNRYNRSLVYMHKTKQATAHTFMYRGPTARPEPLILLVRQGVDPNSLVATRIKQEMREAAPGLFIPARFSPSADELRLLEDLDKSKKEKPSSQVQRTSSISAKFRNLRTIEAVETFTAPAYAQESEKMVDHPKKRSYNMYWPSNNHNSKRQRLSQDVEGEEPRAESQDALIDPALRAWASGSNQATGGPNSAQPGTQESSVIGAVQAYGLLPRRGYEVLDRRKPEKRKPARKTVRKAQQPRRILRGPEPAVFQFMEPNTLLDARGDDDTDEDDDGDQSPIPQEPSGSQPEPSSNSNSPEEKTVKFVPGTLLKQNSGGGWPILDATYFEKHENSFNVLGTLPSFLDLLIDNLPATAEDMAALSLGMPPTPDVSVDRDLIEEQKFEYLVNGVKGFERSRLGSQIFRRCRLAPDYRYINFSSPVVPNPDAEPIQELTWVTDVIEDSWQYQSDDDDDDDDDSVDGGRMTWTPLEPPRIGRAIVAKSQARKKWIQLPGARSQKKVRVVNTKVQRDLTPYPQKNEFYRQKDEMAEGLDWGSKGVKLIAFVVVSCLLGGVSRTVDWGIILRLFPDITISVLRHFWASTRREEMSVVENLTEKFRAAYLKAYEKDEVPPLNYDDPASYDWKGVIKWAMNLEETKASNVQLPASFDAFSRSNTLIDNDDDKPWRESFHEIARSSYKRFQDVTKDAMSIPAYEARPIRPTVTPFDVAISWNRALCVTPKARHGDEDRVADKLESLCGLDQEEVTDLLTRANKELQLTSIITKSSYRITNNRVWRLNQSVLETFDKRCFLDRFTSAWAFKKKLDAAFRAGEKLRVPYFEKDGVDGTTMATLDLNANSRIIIEPVDQPYVPLGHRPGDYETRKYPKKYAHFKLEMSPTKEYIYSDAEAEKAHEKAPNELMALYRRVRDAEPPNEGPLGAVPIWCDLYGNVDKERFVKVVASVFMVMATRGGMRAHDITLAFRSSLMDFESQLLLDWLESVGLLRAPFPGGALAPAEWWWIVVSALEEGLDLDLGTIKPYEPKVKRGTKRRKLLPMGRRVFNVVPSNRGRR